VVFAGGDPVSLALATHLPDVPLVVAADSGLEHAQTLGRHVHLVVGDLDSVDPGALADAEARGTEVERHPAEKDATDLEIAIDAARARGAQHITVVGGHGGRLDHFLANAVLLASDRFADVEIDAWIGSARVAVARTRMEIRGAVGSLCTLLPVGGEARGVTTDGLRYPLADDVLAPGSTRGVSNVLLSTTAAVSLRAGTLLVIQPDHLEVLP
jgi:thiamine pyrophosphokinase